jgi:hypothetical protein
MENKYLISEFYEFKLDENMIVESDGNDKDKPLTLVGILQKADTLNRNGRIYPYEILKREATKYMELIEQRVAYGECDHPAHAIISLATTCHMVTDMWWEGKTLYGKVVIFDDIPSGKIIKGILKRGGVLGISSRGVGSVKTIQGNDVVQDDFELIAFDFVSSPSTPGAYMFQEGTNKKMNGMQLISSVKPKIEENTVKNTLFNDLKNDFWKNI